VSEHVDESSHSDRSRSRPAHPFVPGERQRLDESVDARLVARGDAYDIRSLMLGRHALCESASRHADEASVGEHGERTGALADEMCRRLERRAKANAAARKQRDARWIADHPTASAVSRPSSSEADRRVTPKGLWSAARIVVERDPRRARMPEVIEEREIACSRRVRRRDRSMDR
jgi:hypothetical protein